MSGGTGPGWVGAKDWVNLGRGLCVADGLSPMLKEGTGGESGRRDSGTLRPWDMERGSEEKT